MYGNRAQNDVDPQTNDGDEMVVHRAVFAVLTMKFLNFQESFPVFKKITGPLVII